VQESSLNLGTHATLGNGDPVAFVISENIHRRHLTKQQQADLIVAAHKAEESSRQDGKVIKRHVRGKRRSEKDQVKAAAIGNCQGARHIQAHGRAVIGEGRRAGASAEAIKTKKADQERGPSGRARDNTRGLGGSMGGRRNQRQEKSGRRLIVESYIDTA
jgi:hypothetical protein